MHALQVGRGDALDPDLVIAWVADGSLALAHTRQHGIDGLGAGRRLRVDLLCDLLRLLARGVLGRFGNQRFALPARFAEPGEVLDGGFHHV